MTLVLKLGGSVITHKADNRLEVREDVVRRLCRELRSARAQRPCRLVLVHGAGPFGHSVVAQYGIQRGLDVARGVEGFVRTHNAMQDLNHRIMSLFREEGLYPFPVQTSACLTQDGGRVAWFETRVVAGLLDVDASIIPILYGDMVLDARARASVCSGDAVVAHLAPALGASRVLLGTDVDGIYTADPRHDPSARHIERVTPENFDEVRRAVKGSRAVDVTGGMEKKLLEVRAHLSGVDCVIFDALKPGQLTRALLGEPVGTVIQL